MKTQMKLLLAVLILLGGFSNLSAQHYHKKHHRKHFKRGYTAPSTGISFRGNYWDAFQGGNGISIRNNRYGDRYDIEGYGGSLLFFNRIGPQMIADISIGAVAKVELIEEFADFDLIQVDAVVPLLFGIRYDMVPINQRAGLRPYIAFGGGLYFTNELEIEDYFYYEEEVTSISETQTGFYFGGGADFKLGRHVALTGDVRYHMIDLPPNSKFQNGLDFSLGLTFMWGRY